MEIYPKKKWKRRDSSDPAWAKLGDTPNERRRRADDIERDRRQFWMWAVGIIIAIVVAFFAGQSSQNIINDSPQSINTINQSGGTNNLNINDESEYIWTNEKVWSASPTGSGNYQVNLTFIAGGPVIPVSPCLYVQADAELVSAGPIGSSSFWATGTSDEGVYIKCFHGLANSVTFQVFFKSKPTKLGARLVQDDRGLEATISQPSFTLPVVQ